MVDLFGVNLGTVLIAGIAAYLLGWVWHSLFGKAMTAKKKRMTKAYIGEFVALLVTAFALGAILGEMDVTGIWSGVGLGALAWLGFVAATTFSRVLWDGQDFGAWLSGNAYRLVAFMLMGAIMAW